MKEIVIKDWYKTIPKKYINSTHNPHFNIHNIKLPMRMIIAGSSGSGKTQTLLNLIYNMPDTFEKIYICTKNKAEPLYEFLEDKYKNNGIEIMEFPDLPDLDSFDKTENSLVVLDDLCNETVKAQRPIADFFIRARKLNASLIYISQSFYQVPKLIRDNINYLIIKQVSSMKNLTMIMREFSLGINKDKLKEIYNDATKTKQTFLLIDLETNDKTKMFRKGLSEYYENLDLDI